MTASSNPLAILFFFVFIALTLGVTYWAARRTKTTEHFYAAGHGVTGFQNGLALAGDYMRLRASSASPGWSRSTASTG